MISLAVALIFLAFAMLVGLGVLSLTRRAELGVLDVLISPAVGFALLIVIAVPLNRSGLPVASFAIPLTLLLAVSAAYTSSRHRFVIAKAMVSCWFFAPVVIGALLLTASPMITYGSNWFAYANEDAINYSLSAERLREAGLYAKPDAPDFITDRDVAGHMYFLNGAARERYGADELLALEASVVQLDSFRTIMPCIVALHLAGILSLSALVYRGKYAAAQAILAALALSVSALATSGVAHQLLGQVVGLALLSALLATACSASVRESTLARCLDALLIALLCAALCEAYPELVPYAVLTIIAYYLLCQRRQIASRGPYLAMAAMASLLFVNTYVMNIAYVMNDRLVARPDYNAVFPYYLIPSGASNLFGLSPIGIFAAEPMLSLSIACGIALVVALSVATLYGVRRQEPVAVIMIFYLITLVLLFARQSGFSLFKLAMYIQPAVAGVFAILFVGVWTSTRWNGWRIAAAAGALGIFITNIVTQQTYVTASRGSGDISSANFLEVWDISGGHTFDRLAALRRLLTPGENVLSDANNPALAQIESFYVRHIASVSFPAGDEQQVRGILPGAHHAFGDPARYAVARQLLAERARRYSSRVFRFGHLSARFLIDKLDDPSASKLWLHGSDSSPFNRASLGLTDFVSSPHHEDNVLAFVSSSLGFAAYGHDTDVGLFPLEPDVFFPGSTMTAVGRYLLFEVLNPRGPIRVRVALSNTSRGDGESVIPPVSVIGVKRVPLAVTGRGSADIISDIVEPRRIDGHSYVLLDLGIRPTSFPMQRTGLMRLWGRDLPLDRRLVTTFVRDVSAVGPGYRENRPGSIGIFPDDLRSGHVEYSGIYEDGWASENVTLTLQVGNDGTAHLRGFVPDTGDPAFQSNVTCYVDGFRQSASTVAVGYNDISVMAGRGAHRIEWRFSKYQRLPRGDRRPVSMLIKSVG